MIVITLGGVAVTFGYPGSSGAAPFYPYLLSVDRVEQATGDSTATASCHLDLKAKELIDLNVLAPITILSALGDTLVSGLIGKIEYGTDIHITVEA